MLFCTIFHGLFIALRLLTAGAVHVGAPPIGGLRAMGQVGAYGAVLLLMVCAALARGCARCDCRAAISTGKRVLRSLIGRDKADGEVVQGAGEVRCGGRVRPWPAPPLRDGLPSGAGPVPRKAHRLPTDCYRGCSASWRGPPNCPCWCRARRWCERHGLLPDVARPAACPSRGHRAAWTSRWWTVSVQIASCRGGSCPRTAPGGSRSMEPRQHPLGLIGNVPFRGTDSLATGK